MLCVRWAILTFGLVILLPNLHAEPLRIEGDRPRNQITVTMDEAKIGPILKRFSEVYGIEIRGIENTEQGDPISASMTGSLQAILKRLLRNRNHLIVLSPDSISGVDKVLILDSTYGVLPLKRPKIRRKIRRRIQRKKARPKPASKRASTKSQATTISRRY